jgi:predicted GIY-YIG superfamily endonuclease
MASSSPRNCAVESTWSSWRLAGYAVSSDTVLASQAQCGRSVEERVSEHAQSLTTGYTFTRKPVKLVFSEHYERIVDVIAVERRIKGWSRAKEEVYMRSDFFDPRCAFEKRFKSGREDSWA